METIENRNTLRVAGFVKESVCDGPGIRFTIFVQGCFHNCEGCHNPHTHDPNGGYDITIDEFLKMIDSNPLLEGVTFSGGEPFLQAESLVDLAKECRERGLSIVTYTGYLHEEIVKESENAAWQELLELTDILIDGPFVRELETHGKIFRGSSNQKIVLR